MRWETVTNMSCTYVKFMLGTGCVLNTQNPKSYIIWGPLKFQLDTNMFRGTLSHTILMGIVDISQRTFFKPGGTFSTGNAKGTALIKVN